MLVAEAVGRGLEEERAWRRGWSTKQRECLAKNYGSGWQVSSEIQREYKSLTLLRAASDKATVWPKYCADGAEPRGMKPIPEGVGVEGIEQIISRGKRDAPSKNYFRS